MPDRRWVFRARSADSGFPGSSADAIGSRANRWIPLHRDHGEPEPTDIDLAHRIAIDQHGPHPRTRSRLLDSPGMCHRDGNRHQHGTRADDGLKQQKEGGKQTDQGAPSLRRGTSDPAAPERG